MVGVGAVVGASASVADADHSRSIPSDVTVEYDQDWLETYQPELVFEAETYQKFLGLYGLKATSDNHDLAAGAYWASYSHQNGVLWNGLDSHRGDHEPAYVFVDEATGEAQVVVASVYHWIAGKSPTSELTMTGESPRLKVISPWHQYSATATEGVQPEVRDLTDAMPDWLDNGLEEALAKSQPYVPWRMLSRDSWWAEDSGYGISNEALVELLRGAGVGREGSL